MAQGEFTKEEAEETITAVNELYEALHQTRRREYIGHLNSIFLYLEASKVAAPDQKEE